MIIGESLSLEEKLRILGDAAKYDVACTSSGVDRGGKGFAMGNAVAAGICHSFSADGRCISLLKILMTNECVYECKYCINRASNDVVRATFTPEEVARLTIEFYRRNYIEGLFLSSGVYPDPQASMERMLAAVRLLRVRYGFGGYIHVKAIPGALPETLNEIGWLCDRMSVNLELPTAESLKSLAPNKTRRHILTPMRYVQNGIRQNNGIPMIGTGKEENSENDRLPLSLRAGFMKKDRALTEGRSAALVGKAEDRALPGGNGAVSPYAASDLLYERPRYGMRRFVPAGQSTQMIIGATPESDYEIMSVTEQLYQRFDLKRVFFSAFINVNQDNDMPEYTGRTLLEREHRLYQADFLLRYYNFKADDLLSPERPHFNLLVDPKCDYALRHLEIFPVEINKAPMDTLLKVPGIGVRSAQRIIKARRGARLDFNDLKKLGVVLKRAVYFITCGGRQYIPFHLNEDRILSYLLDGSGHKSIGEAVSYQQLSLFDLNPAAMGVGGNDSFPKAERIGSIESLYG